MSTADMIRDLAVQVGALWRQIRQIESRDGVQGTLVTDAVRASSSSGLRLEDDAGNLGVLVADTGIVYLAGSTNGVKIATDGTLTLLGTSTAWDDLRVEPSVKGSGANNPALEQYFTNGAGSVGVFLYSFTDVAAANEKEVYFTAQLPHAWAQTAIYIHVHWIPSASDTVATPRWGLEYTWANPGSVYGNTTIVYATGNVQNATDLVANTHYITAFSAITPSASQDSFSSVLICRLFRNSSDAADTYNVGGNKCGLLYVDIHYEINKFGTNLEYS